MHFGDAVYSFGCRITDLKSKEIANMSTVSIFIPDWVQNVQVKVLVILAGRATLDHVPSELLSMFPNLQKLKITAEIKEIVAENFSTPTNQSRLTHIYLSHNRLTAIRKNSFAGLLALERLDVSENMIYTIEDGAFDGLSKLKYLNLYWNKIVALSDHTFDGLIAIKGLNLAFNKIESIGNSIYKLDSVEKVMLSYNKIGDIDFLKIAILPNLKELNLEHAAVNLSRTLILNNIDLEEPTQSGLEILDLGFNNLTIEGNTLFKIIRLFPNLKTLNMPDEANKIRLKSLNVTFTSVKSYYSI